MANRNAILGGLLAVGAASIGYWLLIRAKTSAGVSGSSFTPLPYGPGNAMPIQPQIPSTPANKWSNNPIYRNVQHLISAAADTFSLPAGLLDNLLGTESSYKAAIVSGQVKSRTGAAGIAQFMPGTAAQYGVDVADPTSAIPGAGQYLSDLYSRFGDWRYAVAAYNWGEGNVSKWLASGKTTPVPLETRNYVQKILGVSLT